MGSGDLEIAGERESLDMFAGKNGPFGCCGGRLAEQSFTFALHSVHEPKS